eukprot:4160747-Amphidinium_carterae.1
MKAALQSSAIACRVFAIVAVDQNSKVWCWALKMEAQVARRCSGIKIKPLSSRANCDLGTGGGTKLRGPCVQSNHKFLQKWLKHRRVLAASTDQCIRFTYGATTTDTPATRTAAELETVYSFKHGSK